MSVIRATVACAVVVAGLLLAPPVTAQPLGTYRWQLQPYCNVINVAVVQQGGQYQLDGIDDQCGAAQAASVRGLAFLNPNGSIGFGLTIVTAPGGTPVHVDATIELATLSGTWRDSAGNSGAFIRTPGAGTGGSPRPAPLPLLQRFYSGYRTPAAASVETSLDGTLMRTYFLPEALITQSVVDTAQVQVWLRFGTQEIPLPYTSMAGGTANTVWARPEEGGIRVYRMTHGCNTSACLIGLPSLDYRFTVVTGGRLVP